MLDKIYRIKDQKKMQKALDKWHEERTESLRRLASHGDFETLIEYWKLEHDMIDKRLDGLRGRELEDAVLERKIINKHLNWIRSLTE